MQPAAPRCARLFVTEKPCHSNVWRNMLPPFASQYSSQERNHWRSVSFSANADGGIHTVERPVCNRHQSSVRESFRTAAFSKRDCVLSFVAIIHENNKLSFKLVREGKNSDRQVTSFNNFQSSRSNLLKKLERICPNNLGI